jgi:Ca2+-binding EF-hand superfamily protein
MWTFTRMMSVFVFAGLAIAQFREGRGPGRGGFPPSIGFMALDANGDGVLDAAELDAAPTVLAKLDKNSDGRITADEVRPAFPDRREGEGRRGPEGGQGGNVVEETVKTLMAFDANHDGKLSKDELPERMQGLFDRADVDKDGFLTADEIRKLASANAAPAQTGPGEGRGREMNMIRMDPVLAAVDVNGDGILSADEIRNAANSIRNLDADGDGRITREEVMSLMRRR